MRRDLAGPRTVFEQVGARQAAHRARGVLEPQVQRARLEAAEHLAALDGVAPEHRERIAVPAAGEVANVRRIGREGETGLS